MLRGNTYSYDDYVVLEEHSLVKHEYLAGEIYAMAGGMPGHAALAGMVITLLGIQLQSGCRVYTSDLRVRIVETDMATYPDVSVVCGPIERAGDDRIAVVNPIVVVEVTSASTEQYDRNAKLAHYRFLPSLREVLIVSHREPRLTLHQRRDTGWDTSEFRGGQTVELASIAAHLPVDEVYRDGFDELT
jgi:Uma2 family endonuclease